MIAGGGEGVGNQRETAKKSEWASSNLLPLRESSSFYKPTCSEVPPGWQPEVLQGARAEAQRYLTSRPPPSHDTALGTWSSSARASAWRPRGSERNTYKQAEVGSANLYFSPR